MLDNFFVSNSGHYSTLYNGDCIEVMPNLSDKSIDLVLTDLPYGTLKNTKWDDPIDLVEFWNQCNKLLKPNSTVVLFGSQPFTTKLIMSNPKWFKEEVIWDKKAAANVMQAKYQHLKIHENILVFRNGKSTYHPQMVKGKMRTKGGGKRFGDYGLIPIQYQSDEYYPKSIVQFSNAVRNQLHPTEKPIDLLEYLIKTYSLPNSVVLDCCMGSGSTGVAAFNTQRHFIGIELDKTFFDIAHNRITELYK